MLHTLQFIIIIKTLSSHSRRWADGQPTVNAFETDPLRSRSTIRLHWPMTSSSFGRLLSPQGARSKGMMSPLSLLPITNRRSLGLLWRPQFESNRLFWVPRGYRATRTSASPSPHNKQTKSWFVMETPIFSQTDKILVCDGDPDLKANRQVLVCAGDPDFFANRQVLVYFGDPIFFANRQSLGLLWGGVLKLYIECLFDDVIHIVILILCQATSKDNILFQRC